MVMIELNCHYCTMSQLISTLNKLEHISHAILNFSREPELKSVR